MVAFTFTPPNRLEALDNPSAKSTIERISSTSLAVSLPLMSPLKLTSALASQMKEGAKLDEEIKKNLEGIGFKVE